MKLSEERLCMPRSEVLGSKQVAEIANLNLNIDIFVLNTIYKFYMVRLVCQCIECKTHSSVAAITLSLCCSKHIIFYAQYVGCRRCIQ